MKRRGSIALLPPEMTELRVILLGNSWFQRSSVANFILGETQLNTEEEPQSCQTFRGKLKDTHVVLINTPDLLQQNISEVKLSECVEDCVRLSAPGPHVFLLVLQPEDFTEDHKKELCRVLEKFSDQTFDHSLVLIATRRREESPGFMKQNIQEPYIKDLIKKCRYGFLEQKNLEHPELLTRLGQIVKEKRGEHLCCDVFTLAATSGGEQSRTPIFDSVLAAGLHGADEATRTLRSSVEPQRGGLRIVLFGRSEDKKGMLRNFIIQKKGRFWPNFPQARASEEHGEWRGKPITVIKSGDIFSLSVEKVREEVKRYMNLCLPGPNVLLLLVKPPDFTEEEHQILRFILSPFGPDVFKHSMVIMTHHEDRETRSSVTQLLRDCGGRCYNMVDDDHQQLMQKMEEMVHENKGSFLVFGNTKLNLVLCGRRGAGKTSAIKAMLGLTEPDRISSSSETQKHQGEVGGRQVSLLELPALSEKGQEAVMEESFRCFSLCDPEGVHAFILVLPVAPLTDEDKAELKIIRHTFSSKVHDFTTILFTMESHTAAPAVVDFVKHDGDIQELLQSCGGRYVVVNMTDKEGIDKMVDDVAKETAEGSRSFTKDMFTRAQMEKLVRLEAGLKTRSDTKSRECSESLRIVMVGKTGSGKSSSGNTILGRTAFEARPSQSSVTICCQKEKGEVGGRSVFVVDTPGLYDTSMSNEEVNEEMMKCISLLAPGPHVFLLVLQIGRMTSEEKETLKLIKEGFGKHSEKFTFILFTGGDNLKHDKLSIDDYIKKGCDDSFKKLISDCGGRYHVLDNRDVDNQTQVSDLMKKINNMVTENGGSCYTNEMLQEAEAAIKKEVEKILKEKEAEMEREREKLQKQHEEEMREIWIKMNEQNEKIKQEKDLKVQELKEMQKTIEREREERKREKENRDRDKEERQASEERHRQNLKGQLEILDRQIQSEKEEKKCVSKKLEEERERKRQIKEDWEKERREWWEKEKEQESERKQEYQKTMTTLEEKYDEERQKYETKIREDELKLQQEEHKRKEVEDKYEKELEGLRTKHEEEARKRAEEFNEFQEKHTKELAAQSQQHQQHLQDKEEKYNLLQALRVLDEQRSKTRQREINNMVKLVLENKENQEQLSALLRTHEIQLESLTNEEDRKKLQEEQEKEISQLVKKLVKEESPSCVVL